MSWRMNYIFLIDFCKCSIFFFQSTSLEIFPWYKMESIINNLSDLKDIKKKKLDRFLQYHELCETWKKKRHANITPSCLASSVFICCQNRFPYLTSFWLCLFPLFHGMICYYLWSVDFCQVLCALQLRVWPTTLGIFVEAVEIKMNSIKAWWHLWIETH